MSSLRRLVAIFSLCLGFALLLPAPVAQAQNVFVVDDNGDGGDNNAGDGTCQTSGGVCTLRAALEEANAFANVDASTPDSVAFSISTSSLIQPAAALPEITDPLVIDGATAAAGSLPRLRIEGYQLANGDGLSISSGGSTVRGLHIARFPGNGLTLTGAGGNVVENCQIGDVLSQGSPVGFGNGGDGILITGGSTQNHIGDSDDASLRNIIGGNGGNGIRIDGGTNNRIYGNYIGVAADGETDLGNIGHGVLLENQTRFNNIGESQNGALGNVISGNGRNGVMVSGTFGNADFNNTSDNNIGDNRIGVNDAGDTAVPNDGHGVEVDGATKTQIGIFQSSPNVISGNGQYGAYIFGTDITIEGNLIGTDAAGTTAIGNGPSQAGIILVGATSGVTIGTPNQRNVISGNERGIMLNSATGNVIENNYIGVDITGAAALGNEFEGIRLGGASQHNAIGGTADGAGNVISGNGTDGILFTGNNATGNTVAGNHIGVNAAGDADLGNGEHGVLIEDGASSNTLGGTTSAARNVISGNEQTGVMIRDAGSTGNTVLGNYIGTDAAGTAGLENAFSGVSASFSASQNTIGGSANGAGNVIAGNGRSGITIDLGDQNTVYGNKIGVDASGNPLGNSQRGVAISRAVGNVIGGTAAGEGNVIAHNNLEGVLITSSTSTAAGNAVRGNAFFANGDLGVDLDNDGQTPNDPDDSDAGTNRLQNFPEIIEAEYNPFGDQISVTYRVPSDPALTGPGASAYNLTIDFYKVDADREEGAVYLGTGTYTASAYNNGPETFYGFTPPSEANIGNNDFIVATATDDNGNTSEFSEAASLGANLFVVNALGDAGDSDTSDDVCDDGSGACTLRAAIEQANATPNFTIGTAIERPDSISFDLAGNGPHLIQPATELPRISDPLVIDGTSEPDYAGSPLVVLDGQNAAGGVNGASGLYVEAGGSTVRGLAVVNFERNGIVLVTEGGNAVEACYIGVEADGATAAGNSTGGTFAGVFVGSTGNTIGGASADARNVISGNASGNGVQLTGDGNTVENNYIGTDAGGMAAVGNFRGMFITNANNNILRGNVISGNDSPGLGIAANSDNTVVQGNRIGVDANGDPLGNGGRGVFLTTGASGNTIGGTGAGEGNVIAHNGDGGVLFNGGTSGAGTGNAVRGNAIYANTGTINPGLGIDLGTDGKTANDPGDADGSPNNLQNFPEIESADYDDGTDDVTVTYVVDTAPANATYPLAVDFYQADADEEEGAAYLGTDSYTSSDYDGCGVAPCAKTVTFTPQAPVSRSDAVLATATDDAGNTSEFSAQSGALPVELAGFEAAPSGAGRVALTWQTFSETGNDRFRIERRVGGESEGTAGWATLGTRKSQAPGGTSAEALRYRFEDGDLPFEATALTYRLVQRDLDGDETTVGERTVEVGAPTAFTLHGNFPNPVRSRTTIRYELPEKRRVTLTVYDVLGRKVRTLVDEEQTGRQEIPFAANGLSSGTYFYRLTAGDYTQTRKLVLVR